MTRPVRETVLSLSLCPTRQPLSGLTARIMSITRGLQSISPEQSAVGQMNGGI